MCGEKNRARRRTKNFVFLFFLFFFVFFTRKRAVFFLSPSFSALFHRACEFVSITEINLLLCDFKRNSRSLLRYTHRERERVSE